jgi:hypothetical protein
MLAAWPARALAHRLSPPAFSRRDLAPLLLVLLAVPAVVGRPYSQVGIDIAEGRAYRAYFTADFVSNMAIAAEISKGDVPPVNPYFRGDPLHYYWLMHLLPASVHRFARSLRLEQPLLVTALFAALAFAGFLYFLTRHFVESPWAAALGCLFVVFCSSFEGAHQMKWHWDRGRTLEGLRSMNIDAISRSSYQGMPVDGLHRMFLYKPQHEIGYVLGLSALALVAELRDAARAAGMFVAGTFLGLAILFSSFAALMMAAMTAVYAAARLAAARAWRAVVPCALAGAAPMAGAVLLSRALQYVDEGELVAFGVNPIATRNVWTALFLSFGPVAIVAALGVAAVVWRGELRRFAPIWILLLVSAVFYFLVDVPDHQGVYVGWQAGHFAFIGMAALVAYACERWWKAGLVPRAVLLVIALGAGTLGAPTVLQDLFNTQDVWNRNQGPGFRWTVLLSPDEVEGLAWIKRMTPAEARVQVEPFSRGRDTWTYIPAFGERRMAAGLPIGMIPEAKYRSASEAVRQVYLATTAQDAYERAVAACVDYLVIGPPERRAHAHFQPLVDAAPQLFTPAFRNETFAVYAVAGATCDR